ncbi:NADPH-dependent F420 reductase [Nocardiopsis sediminis]|uniref:NADPH-dependent F420 reductase n=1 Tax=Nocardiopsis sediminis TaxID=1778267 RepID=A0ABV8FQJ0_9ACTN
MTTTAILGSGNVARALAEGLRRAGHEVIVGSRRPHEIAAEWAGPGVRVASLADAAGAGEPVINALPGSVSVDVLTGVAEKLAGKVVIDVANAVELDAGGFASALRYPETSLAEELQRALPDARVVKTLNTMHESAMADPAGLSTPPTAFVSGDDSEARRTTAGLLTDLGWRPEWIIDLGGIGTARGPEAFVLMIGDLVRALGPVPFGLSIAR